MRRLFALTLVAMLGAGCAPRVAAPVPTLDVLDYVLGQTSLWPRIGTQTQNQIIDLDRHEVCWTKYGRTNEFECWRWDDTFIYHEVDHAIDGKPGQSYAFSDGRWMPRHLKMNQVWTLDVTGNTQTWYTAACAVDPSNSGPMPYALRVRQLPARDLGPDLGTRDLLVLEYAPHEPGKAPIGEPERFYFAQGAGWFAWTSPRGIAQFDRFGGPALGRTRFCVE